GPACRRHPLRPRSTLSLPPLPHNLAGPARPRQRDPRISPLSALPQSTRSPLDPSLPRTPECGRHCWHAGGAPWTGPYDPLSLYKRRQRPAHARRIHPAPPRAFSLAAAHPITAAAAAIAEGRPELLISPSRPPRTRTLVPLASKEHNAPTAPLLAVNWCSQRRPPCSLEHLAVAVRPAATSLPFVPAAAAENPCPTARFLCYACLCVSYIEGKVDQG
ncbi:hypothetical protein SORBI_3009G061500, partial [Sorghum bicolor]